MAVKMKIRKGDRVVVLTGKDKGKAAEDPHQVHRDNSTDEVLVHRFHSRNKKNKNRKPNKHRTRRHYANQFVVRYHIDDHPIKKDKIES